jgi:hypothetical protein
MPFRKKIILFTSLIAAVVFAVAAWPAAKRELFSLGVVDRVQFAIRTLRLTPYLDELVGLAKVPKNATFDEKVDHIRRFIERNTGYVQDKKLYAANDGYLRVAQMAIAHAKDQSQPLAGIDCSWRSELLMNVLIRMGFEARLVSAFDADLPPGVGQQSHTFLDVKNPATRKWQSQDPEFHIYWKSITTGQRVSILEQAERLDQIMPCNRETCGWDALGVKHLKDLFDIFTVFNITKNKRYSVYSSRANLSTLHENGGRAGDFCDVYFYNCRSGFFSTKEYLEKI